MINIFFAVLCIFLLAVFGVILVTSAKKEKAETEKLSEIAGQQETGIKDYEDVQKHAAEIAEQAEEEENTSGQEETADKAEKSSDEEETQDKASEADAKKPDAETAQTAGAEKEKTAKETADAGKTE